MRPLVIYHEGCVDGFTAAWVAWRAFGPERNARLWPAQYGSAPPSRIAGRDVMIVDFSYPREELIRMHAEARSLVVYDHHATAAAALKGLDFAVFDMNRSGAGLTWDQLFPGQARPWLVDYVEDRDLWRWKLPCSREVSAAIAAIDFNIETWSELADAPGSVVFAHRVASRRTLDSTVDEGDAILRYQRRVVSRHVERARLGTLWAHDEKVPIVNATTCISEIGNELAKDAPYAVMWFVADDGSYVYSLRSCAENFGHVDVSQIARYFGGGGHRHAAGFSRPTAVHFDVRVDTTPEASR